MIENNLVAMLESPQLKYVIPSRQAPSVSKATDTPPNMKQKHKQNVVSTLNNNTADNNRDIINIQLNYDINQAMDKNS